VAQTLRGPAPGDREAAPTRTRSRTSAGRPTARARCGRSARRGVACRTSRGSR